MLGLRRNFGGWLWLVFGYQIRDRFGNRFGNRIGYEFGDCLGSTLRNGLLHCFARGLH
jgi:hypothetical protein